jgi:hypothetical protein
VVLEGFVDDSGTSHGKVAVLAGFLSTAEKWQIFSDELELLCEQDPKTPDFKMEKAHGPRAYWWAGRQELDKRIEDVGALIRKHAMYRIDSVMPISAYDGIVRGRINPKIDSPYFLLFYAVMLSAAEFMEKIGMEGTADFVFDEQGKVGQECASFYPEIKERVAGRVRIRLGSAPIFRDDKDILPIKAADFFAWQIRRHLDVEQPERIAHNAILDGLLSMFGVSCQVREEDLRAFMRDAEHGIMFRGDCCYHLPKPIMTR